MQMQWLKNEGLNEYSVSIPYPPSDEGGRTNVGYFDLKLHPELIEQVHELRRYPEFKKLVSQINRPDSIFRSVRLDVRTEVKGEGARKYLHASYVTIVFEVLSWLRVEDNYRDLYQQLMNYPLSRPPTDSTLIQFRPVWVNLDELEQGGIGIDVIVSGYGRSESQARAAWRDGLTALREFLAGVSRKEIHHLKPGENTIGRRQD